jgi:hypothetical protein
MKQTEIARLSTRHCILRQKILRLTLFLDDTKSQVGERKTFRDFNPLNAELNHICHLLVLLGDLTFMGPCIVSIFQYTCISNKLQRYTVYLYLETALHVSGGTCTQHQERIQLYLQHLVFVTPLLRKPPTAHSNRFQLIAADSSNGVTNTRCCRYRCMRS